MYKNYGNVSQINLKNIPKIYRSMPLTPAAVSPFNSLGSDLFRVRLLL